MRIVAGRIVLKSSRRMSFPILSQRCRYPANAAPDQTMEIKEAKSVQQQVDNEVSTQPAIDVVVGGARDGYLESASRSRQDAPVTWGRTADRAVKQESRIIYNFIISNSCS